MPTIIGTEFLNSIRIVIARSTLLLIAWVRLRVRSAIRKHGFDKLNRSSYCLRPPEHHGSHVAKYAALVFGAIMQTWII